MKTTKFLPSFLAAAFLFVSCSNDDDTPVPVNEEEVITTMTLTLTPADGGTAVVFQTRDLDGDGPNDPVITTAGLEVNTTYNGSIVLLNETESPAENITEEIEEEDEDHQFFFQVSDGVNATVTYTDQDGNGNPVGLGFRLVTGAASSGTLTVTLRHEPNKTASGVSDGDITNAAGETDITATFPISVGVSI